MFYRRGIINKDLFKEDGIHLSDSGTSVLAINTRDSICRILGMEIKENYGPPRRGKFNGRFNNRNNRNFISNNRFR